MERNAFFGPSSRELVLTVPSPATRFMIGYSMYLTTQSTQDHCHMAGKGANIKNPAVRPVCTLLERLGESPIMKVKVFFSFGIIQERNQSLQHIMNVRRVDNFIPREVYSSEMR
jgi:hypothetical protein